MVKIGVLWALAMAVLLGSPALSLAVPIFKPGKVYCDCACVTANGNVELAWEMVAHCAMDNRDCSGTINGQKNPGKLANCQECTSNGCGSPHPPVFQPWPPTPDGPLGAFLSRMALELELTKVGSTPDLVPLTNPGAVGPEGFCRRNDQGQLLVKVFNQGTNEAGASKTLVSFAGAEPESFDTPAIAGRSSAELVIDIPNECFDANNNCSFTIGVDGEEAVTESEETNNNVAGLCGPQFQ